LITTASARARREAPLCGVQFCAVGRVFGMAYGRAYGRRLFLYALIKGLGDAVRHDDEWAVDRYRRRLRSVAADFDTNPQIHESVEGLLWASGQVVDDQCGRARCN
jgi:hypothetical protein